MATPPTQIAGSPFSSTYTGSSLTRVTPSFTVGVGDLIVILWGDEAGDAGGPTFPTITNSGTAQSWTNHQAIVGSPTTQWARAYAWSATASTAQSMTVTITRASSQFHGVTAYVFTAGLHGGVGNTAGNKSPTTAAPSLSITASANSLICASNFDFTAQSHGATRSYITATPGAATEVVYFSNGTNYTAESWYHPDVGTAGTKTVGLSIPTPQTWSSAAVEVLGIVAASGPWTQNTGTAVLPKLASAPGSPTSGQCYYDTGTNQLMGYNGSTWVVL